MASPREELDAALARGDYAAAAQYASPILSINPDDVYANFAVGMDHFGNRAWDLAEKHLMRCVTQNSDEPVFLNNLSIVLLYRGRYDDALAYAQKALKVQPDSEVVQDTIRQIEKARDAEAEKKKAETPSKAPLPTTSEPEQSEPAGLVPSTPAASESM
jgi:Flp pilus assembly protein TadD